MAWAAVRPAVRVTDMRPFTVRGAHFRPLERVLLVVRTKIKTLRTVTATNEGSFVVQIRSGGPMTPEGFSGRGYGRDLSSDPTCEEDE